MFLLITCMTVDEFSMSQLQAFLLVQLDAPVEGLKEWLDAVHTAGIPCAIVSCLDRRYMHESLQKMGLKKYFQVDFMRNSTRPLLFMIFFDAAIKLMVASRGMQAIVTEEDGMESIAHRFLSAAVKVFAKLKT